MSAPFAVVRSLLRPTLECPVEQDQAVRLQSLTKSAFGAPPESNRVMKSRFDGIVDICRGAKSDPVDQGERVSSLEDEALVQHIIAGECGDEVAPQPIKFF